MGAIESGLADRLAALGKVMNDLALDLANLASRSQNNEESGDTAFRFRAPHPKDLSDELILVPSAATRRESRPPMPDPRLIRKIIKHRRQRARYFDDDLFADPAWDMLLDLAAAREEHVRVSVTSLCIASGVPPTTALRWISQMIDAGLLNRTEDTRDKRRAFVSLTEHACDAVAKYFSDLKISELSII